MASPARVDRTPRFSSNGFQLDAQLQTRSVGIPCAEACFAQQRSPRSGRTHFPRLSRPNATGAAGQYSVHLFHLDDSHKNGYLYGVYLQDQWKLLDRLTVNFGGRFDVVNAYTNENQFSPRINLVYKATASTTLHAELRPLLHAAAARTGGAIQRQQIRRDDQRLGSHRQFTRARGKRSLLRRWASRTEV